MIDRSLTGLVSLAALAAIANIAWVPVGVPEYSALGDRCKVTQADLDPYHAAEQLGERINSAMTPQYYLVSATGCEDCELSDTILEDYCESRGTDCDGLLGWDESYLWEREKYIYQCGTPGQPGYGWFVQCSTWTSGDCCDDGETGLPPTNCTHQGAAQCSSRIIID